LGDVVVDERAECVATELAVGEVELRRRKNLLESLFAEALADERRLDLLELGQHLTECEV
jgi:hypothetical protein